MDKKEFIQELAKLRPSSTFLSLIGYRNASSEVADFNIIFHISYKSALQKSLDILNSFDPQTDLDLLAKEELIQSYNNSLLKIESQSIEEIDDAYQRFFDENNNYIKGVKLHRGSNALHLYGMVVHKRLRIPGNYDAKNSKPLTIAKKKISKLCPVSKFRQFKITPNQVDHISVDNLKLLPPV